MQDCFWYVFKLGYYVKNHGPVRVNSDKRHGLEKSDMGQLKW